jgi:hypothetical protein
MVFFTLKNKAYSNLIHAGGVGEDSNLLKTPFPESQCRTLERTHLRGRIVMKSGSSFFCLFPLALGLLTGCDLCKEEIWGTATSPDGKWTATTIMRDCGATTSETISVNVHRTGSKGFEADHNALVMKHGQAPGIVWSGNDHLLLDCSGCDSKDEIARATQIGPIHIEHRMR